MAEFKTSEERRRYFHEYYQTHKAQYAAHSRRWWKARPEKLREKWNRSSRKNRVKRAARQVAYRKKNLEMVRAKNRKWQSDCWEHRQEYMRNYYAKNREKIKAQVGSYYQKNKARWWNHGAKRRALVKQASSNLEILREFAESIRKKKKCLCYYCGTCLPGSAVHFDHVIPLSKGGTHSIENLCVSCPSCNLSKNDALLNRWTKHPQTFLQL